VPVPVPVRATVAVVVIVPFAPFVLLIKMPGPTKGQKNYQVGKQLEEHVDGDQSGHSEADAFDGLIFLHFDFAVNEVKQSQAPVEDAWPC
jgi:hypothetical protein